LFKRSGQHTQRGAALAKRSARAGGHDNTQPAQHNKAGRAGQGRAQAIAAQAARQETLNLN